MRKSIPAFQVLEAKPARFAIAAAMIIGSGCGSGSAGKATDAFPADLAIASPTTLSEGSGSPTTRVAGTASADSKRSALLVNLNDQTYATLTSALATMLAPTDESDCAFEFDITPQFINAACYGPMIDYENHPDGTDGDPLPGGDVGLWSETDSSGTACAVAQMNARMNGIARLANGAVFLGASAYCSASLDEDTGLPDDGETKDITDVMDLTLRTGDMSIAVSDASLRRDGDTYTAEVSGTTSDDEPIYVRVIHENGVGGDYIGKISLTVEQNDAELLNCGTGVGNVTHAVSIAYELSGDEMKYEVNSGTFCGAGAEPFTSGDNYTVDASNKYDPSSNPDGWANNFSRARVEFDRSSYEGTYGFTWQAGMGDSHSRTMLMSIQDLAASSAGIAYFGFGPTIENSDGAEISGMICNWAGPGASHALAPLVQKQTFGGTSGTYSPIDSSLAYAPVNGCSTDVSDFTYHAVTGTQSSPTDVVPDMSNDHSTGGAVAHALEAYVSGDMPAPAGPTDIDE